MSCRPDDYVAGLPIEWIVDTFFFTHSVTHGGVILNGWPDGRPLHKQPQLWLRITQVARDEVGKWSVTKR